MTVRDLTKTGKEMLASAQTLLHGKKTPKPEFQEDPIKTGQELVDTASTLFDGMKSGSFDGEMAMKLVQKYAFGVLCHIEPKIEMNENLKLQNDFCQQLKNGKSIEEAAESVESSAINLIQNLDKSKILQNIRQKIAENSFLDEENKEKMAKQLGHFKIEMDKFNAIKIVYNQHENRRRKRARPGDDHDEEEDDDDGDDDDDKVQEMEEGKPAGRKAKFGAAIKSEKAKKAGLVLICIIVLVIMLGAFGTLTVTQSGQPLQPLFTVVSIVLLLLLLCTSAVYCCLKD